MRQEANKFWRLTSDHAEVAEERGGEDRSQNTEVRRENGERRTPVRESARG